MQCKVDEKALTAHFLLNSFSFVTLFYFSSSRNTREPNIDGYIPLTFQFHNPVSEKHPF